MISSIGTHANNKLVQIISQQLDLGGHDEFYNILVLGHFFRREGLGEETNLVILGVLRVGSLAPMFTIRAC